MLLAEYCELFEAIMLQEKPYVSSRNISELINLHLK